MNKPSSPGLSSAQAAQLLSQHGPNEIPGTHRFSLLGTFLSQFKNLLVLLLLAATLISLLLGETVDGIFILIIVIVNAFFGVYQEFKAERSLSALKKMTVTTVRVLRDSREIEIDNRYLVPGDLIYLEEGAKIPADADLLESSHLLVNEAALTGESLPVEKQVSSDNNHIYMGTVISHGRCWAIVTHTGSSTRFGQIAVSLSGISEGQTPLQIKLSGLTRQIGLVGTLASLLVFVLSFLQDKTLIESFIFAVSLAVAAVPEGLPAVMTITLAIGVEKMARRKAIVRKLNAIETLGSVTLLATDKTGTLTTNQMQVKSIWVSDREYDLAQPPLKSPAFSQILLNGVLCSTATLVPKSDQSGFDILGDTTEGAMLLLSENLDQSVSSIKSSWSVIDEISFNPVTKRMTVLVKKDKTSYVFTKGAPESVMSICDYELSGDTAKKLTADRKHQITKAYQSFANRGLRTLAFSYKEPNGNSLENQHVFLGFVGIADPVRPEVTAAVSKATQAGIKVVMITGDNALTAQAIALETGIIQPGDRILSGQDLDNMSDSELLPLLSNVRVFARSTPEQKLRLVKLFQSQGEIVAVTGDGVNDALAIKQADVGVAMGLTGTDVAKETADMVITDDNFSSLVNAVEAGRNIYYHIKNSVKFLLGCNVGEVLYILIAVIFHLPLLTPLQILYMNLVTDGLPAISFAFSPPSSQVMQDRPNSAKSILNRLDFRYVVVVGILTAVVGFISAYFGSVTTLFTSIILVQHFVLVDTWLSHRPIFHHLLDLKNNVFLAAFFLPIFVHPALLYFIQLNKVFDTIPLSPLMLLFSTCTPLLMLFILELSKHRGLKFL